MNILYISTSFPSPGQGATIYTDLAEALHQAGHNITVVVAEQIKESKKTKLQKERGFDVLRVVTGNYYDVGMIAKGISTLIYPFFMKRAIDQYLGKRLFDLVLFESPPITNASLVMWCKKKFNCLSYLMLKDIFPQNAVDIAVMRKGGILYNFFKLKEKKLYQAADYIGCMSSANRDYIIRNNSWLDKNKIEIFPNTKRITSDVTLPEKNARGKYNIPERACVFLFGGNMGKPQYVDILIHAIKKCKDDENIFFIFVGRGTERHRIEQAIELDSITNAKVLDNLPRDAYEQITKECNVGIISLDPRFTIPNYPSRILSYMEYAKPVIAATDKATDLKDLILEANCGLWVWSGDGDKFVEKIKAMSKDEHLDEMGRNGRLYLQNNFTLEKSVSILEKHFKK